MWREESTGRDIHCELSAVLCRPSSNCRCRMPTGRPDDSATPEDGRWAKGRMHVSLPAHGAQFTARASRGAPQVTDDPFHSNVPSAKDSLQAARNDCEGRA